jgi:hypothetical protein
VLDRLFDWLDRRNQKTEAPQPARVIPNMAVWERRFEIAKDAPMVALSDYELQSFCQSLLVNDYYAQGGGPDIYFEKSLKVLLQIEPPYDETAIRIYGGKVKTLAAMNVTLKRQREDELMQQLRQIMDKVLNI